MRARLLCAVLLLQPSTAAAQLNTAPFWEHAAPRPHGGLRLLSGASISGLSAAAATTQLAASATLRADWITTTLHAGALYHPRSVNAAGATLSTRFRLPGTVLDVRAGAGAAPDEHRGPSVTSFGTTLARKGLLFSLRSSILPATREQTYQLRYTERDTTFVIDQIVPAQPRRVYTDLELAYQHNIRRILFDAALGHRLGKHVDRTYWVRANATLSLAGGLAVGAGIARDPGAPWLRNGTRHALSVFVRVDPLPGARDERDVAIPVRLQGLRITSGATTTFAFVAPRAKRVEIAGTFSDWQAVALQREGGGEWRASLALARGVHQIAMRIDGGAWHAPPGLPSIPDEFGGAAGIFEIR